MVCQAINCCNWFSMSLLATYTEAINADFSLDELGVVILYPLTYLVVGGVFSQFYSHIAHVCSRE